MTPGGWIIMIVSVGGVSALFGWALYNVLTKKTAEEHIHSMFEETPDMDQER